MRREELFLDDLLLTRTAEAVEQLEEIQDQAASLSGSGTTIGQVAVWNGSAFVPGILIGDSNGLSIAVVSSPSFGLQAALQQDLKNTASPTFNALTLTSLLVGAGGTSVKKIQGGTFNADPGSIGATSTGTVDVTITGLAVGDVVILMRPDGLHDDLIFSGHRVQAANTLRIYLYNPTAGAIDDGSLQWEFCWLDLT